MPVERKDRYRHSFLKILHRNLWCGMTDSIGSDSQKSKGKSTGFQAFGNLRSSPVCQVQHSTGADAAEKASA